MRKAICAVGCVMASLSLASASLAIPASDGWKPQAAGDEDPQPAAKLNPTGRTYEIEVPLTIDGARLGDVGIKITPDDKVSVDAKVLKIYLGKVYLPEMLTAALAVPEENATQTADGSVVSKKTPGAPGSVVQTASLQPDAKEPGQLAGSNPVYVALATLKDRGIDLRYNPQTLELEAYPAVDQRPTSTVSFGAQEEVASETPETPAYVSAYLNMRLSASYVSQSTSGTGLQAPTIDFDGATRIGPFVLEGEGTFFSPGTTWLAQDYFQDYVFYRRGTRLVYDWPDEALRFRLGDVIPDYTGFQTAPDLLGISASVEYAQLQPGKSIRPTGNHSFRIERPSNVDIIVDNVMVKRIRLAPGNYNLTDLPLNPGANNVKLVIEDDTGARQTLEFTGFSGHELLAPSISEWSFNAGVKSYDTGVADTSYYQTTPSLINTTLANRSYRNSFYAQREYFLDQPAVSAFYRRGILDWLTTDVNAQADTNVAMAGAGFSTQTIAGYIMGEVAASELYSGAPGAAIRLGYGYDKFDWYGYRSSFRILGEYRSHDFETVAVYTSPIDYTAYVAGTYTQSLPWDLTAGLSFSYYYVDEAAALNGEGDRWEADVSLSSQIWDNVSGSISLGYGRDQAADTTVCCVYNQNGFQAFVRLAWTPDAHTNAFASYDSRSQTGQATYTQTSETQGVGSWTATATAETMPDGESSVSASATYIANRAEVYFGHAAGFSGMGYGAPFSPNSNEEVTSVGVATSFVYADGAWGIGRRVSNGFALVTPHESLKDSPVIVGTQDAILAQTDWLGAAVVSSATPYRQNRLTYDAPGAPSGYDLGSAAYDLKAPYKAGYNLQAGSAYTITAMGTLLDAEGQPLPLLAGEAREAAKENGRKVELFTNRAGRFGAQGLAPGKWIIEMPTDGEPTRYVMEVPEGVVGLHNAGTLKPDGSAGQQKPPVIEAKAETDNGTN